MRPLGSGGRGLMSRPSCRVCGQYTGHWDGCPNAGCEPCDRCMRRYRRAWSPTRRPGGTRPVWLIPNPGDTVLVKVTPADGSAVFMAHFVELVLSTGELPVLTVDRFLSPGDQVEVMAPDEWFGVMRKDIVPPMRVKSVIEASGGSGRTESRVTVTKV